LKSLKGSSRKLDGNSTIEASEICLAIEKAAESDLAGGVKTSSVKAAIAEEVDKKAAFVISW